MLVFSPRQLCGAVFFVFHVKFLHKNFVSREKVIIFAAYRGKGSVETQKRVLT